MSKATASGKCPPAGNLPKLSSGFLLPEALPAQQLQGPGEVACCKAHNSSCARTGLRGQSAPWAGEPGLRGRPEAGVNPGDLSQTCTTLPRVLGMGMAQQGSPNEGHGKARAVQRNRAWKSWQG